MKKKCPFVVTKMTSWDSWVVRVFFCIKMEIRGRKQEKSKFYSQKGERKGHLGAMQ
jgi:hypothetical protein